MTYCLVTFLAYWSKVALQRTVWQFDEFHKSILRIFVKMKLMMHMRCSPISTSFFVIQTFILVLSQHFSPEISPCPGEIKRICFSFQTPPPPTPGIHVVFATHTHLNNNSQAPPRRFVWDQPVDARVLSKNKRALLFDGLL